MNLFWLERRRPSAAVYDHETSERMAACKSGHICFGGGKGGGQQAAPTTTTVNQNKLPEYAQPYVEQALQQGQALAQNAYTPYPGQQLADFNPQQMQAIDMAGQLPNATAGTFGGASSAFSGTANYQPGMVNSSYAPGATASTYNPGSFSQQSWTSPGVAQSFMDPYQQAVTDQTIRQINQQAGLQKNQIAGNAAAAGAFGGDRETVAQGLNDYYTQQAVGQAQAAGGQAAYASGQNQFNQQQNLGLQGFQANQQAGQQGANLGLQAFQQNQQAAQAAGAQSLSAQQANQQAMANAAQLRNQAGQGLTTLGGAQQQAALQNQQALTNAGGLLQAQDQSGLNIGYQNFLNQLNFPYQQVGFQSSIINGLPIGNIGTAAKYDNPNSVSQMLGLGLGGLGLSQALGKTS